MTNRLCSFVIDKLRDERSFTSVAREVNLSVSTVIRIFNVISYPKAELSTALSIDEFKGNTNGEKYQCILTDPVNKVVLKENGLKPVRFHDLRHSCASLLLANGVPMKMIQDWLGHSDMGTTANIYSHIDSESKKASAMAIGTALG